MPSTPAPARPTGWGSGDTRGASGCSSTEQEVGEYWDTDYLFTFGTFALFTRASQTYELTGTFDDFAFWNIKFIP